MKLRPYQARAVEKMLWAMTLEGNDVITIAQGGGKTHVIAEFTKRLKQPMLILVPNKELLEQDLSKLEMVVPREKIGIYSASMNSKEVKKYTLATIQSAYKHPEQFAHYDVVIIDECDLLNPRKINGMYNQFFRAIDEPKLFGLTATPYRQAIIYKRWGALKWQVESITTTKMIQRIKPFVWRRMLVVVNTDELLEQGYLSPIEYHDVALMDHKEIPTNKSKSDFNLEKFNQMLKDRYVTITQTIMELPHKAKLVFCASIEQAETLQKLMPDSVVITSKTTKKVRTKAVNDLKEGKLQILLNVGIYTVGFDYPSLDCIVLLRPTRSLRLHCQILGRVSRIAPGKTVGHVYDFVSNVKNLGQLDDIRIERCYNKWNVTSKAYPEGFHYVPLYKFRLKKPK